MATAGNSKQLLNTLEVRVLDAKKKSSYLVRRITNFPVLESVVELRSTLVKFLPDLADKITQGCPLGYILTRNKKISIMSSNDLEIAYGYFINGNHLWIDPVSIKDQTREDAGGSTTAMTAGSKSR
jgi:hypothetical protein